MDARQRELFYRHVNYIHRQFGANEADVMRQCLLELDDALVRIADLEREVLRQRERETEDATTADTTPGEPEVYTYLVAFDWTGPQGAGTATIPIRRSTPILTVEDVNSVRDWILATDKRFTKVMVHPTWREMKG